MDNGSVTVREGTFSGYIEMANYTGEKASSSLTLIDTAYDGQILLYSGP